MKKYLFICLLIFIIFIFLNGNQSFAASVYDDVRGNPIGQITPDLPGFLYEAALNYYNSSNYTDYFIIRTDNHNSGPDFWLILFNAQSSDTFFVNTTDISSTGFYWFMSSRSNIATSTYSLTGTDENDVNISLVSTALSFGSGAYKYQIRGVYAGSQYVYFNNGSNAVDINKPFYNGVIYNTFGFYMIDNSTYLDRLVSGEEIYFFWFEGPKVPGFEYNMNNSIPPYPVWIYMHDVTYNSPPSYDYINGTTSVFIDLNDYTNLNGYPLWTFMTEAISKNPDHISYAIPTVYPFGSYQDGHTYEIYLMYSVNGGSVVETEHYTWTTNFTSAGLEFQNKNATDKTLTNIDKVNRYLASNNLNNEYINIPSITVNDPTYSFFTTIIELITNAILTANEYESITFDFLGASFTVNMSEFKFLAGDDFYVLRNFLHGFVNFSIIIAILLDIRRRLILLKEFRWDAMFADDVITKII